MTQSEGHAPPIQGLTLAAERVFAWYPPDIFDGSSGDRGPLDIIALREALATLPTGARAGEGRG